MPYIPNTPESHTAVLTPLTPTVCRGVSNDGKPCKKELTRNATSGQPQSGILAIVGKDQAYFCSRHQDQAQDVVLRHTASFARRRALVGRGSLDTLIEQVELLVGDSSGPTLSTTVVSTTRPVAAGNDPFYRPPVEDETQHPAPKPPSPPTGHQQQHNRPPRKRRGLLARLILGCCCGPEREDPDDEKNWSDRRREAELRSAAAAVVDENFPKTPMRARKNRPADAHVAFNSVPPTPPLPMMYPPQKPASAMARTSRATVAGHGLSPTTPATVDEDAISEESDDDDVPAIDMSKLTSDQRRRTPPLSPPKPI